MTIKFAIYWVQVGWKVMIYSWNPFVRKLPSKRKLMRHNDQVPSCHGILTCRRRHSGGGPSTKYDGGDCVPYLLTVLKTTTWPLFDSTNPLFQFHEYCAYVLVLRVVRKYENRLWCNHFLRNRNASSNHDFPKPFISCYLIHNASCDISFVCSASLKFQVISQDSWQMA